jgi:hypothetical protein
MLVTAFTYKKKPKLKKLNLNKRMKTLKSLILWLGLKAKRKKQRFKFYFYLNNFLQKNSFKFQTNQRLKLAKKNSKLTHRSAIKRIKKK